MKTEASCKQFCPNPTFTPLYQHVNESIAKGLNTEISKSAYLRVRHSGCKFCSKNDVREKVVTNVGALRLGLGSSDQRKSKKHKFTFELSLNAKVHRKQLP